MSDLSLSCRISILRTLISNLLTLLRCLIYNEEQHDHWILMLECTTDIIFLINLLHTIESAHIKKILSYHRRLHDRLSKYVWRYPSSRGHDIRCNVGVQGDETKCTSDCPSPGDDLLKWNSGQRRHDKEQAIISVHRSSISLSGILHFHSSSWPWSSSSWFFPISSWIWEILFQISAYWSRRRLHVHRRRRLHSSSWIL